MYFLSLIPSLPGSEIESYPSVNLHCCRQVTWRQQIDSINFMFRIDSKNRVAQIVDGNNVLKPITMLIRQHATKARSKTGHTAVLAPKSGVVCEFHKCYKQRSVVVDSRFVSRSLEIVMVIVPLTFPCFTELLQVLGCI